jgi:predicted RNA-binding protein
MILRRFAAINSKYLVEWLADFEAPILKIVELLFKDKEDSNKIYLIDTIINLSKFVLLIEHRKIKGSSKLTSI